MSDVHVLAIEGNERDAIVSRILEGAVGCTVERCSSLASAVSRVGDSELPVPNVVLLDLSLPDSEGIDTLERFCSVSELPIVVVTDDDDPAHAMALIDRGAQDYLVKSDISNAAIARLVRRTIERARLVREIRETCDRALIAARGQSAFVVAIGQHEIPSPLNAILRIADRLFDTALELDQREYVEILRRSVRALKGLLDDTFELSRGDYCGIELSREPFEVKDLVYECLESFASAARRKGLALSGDVAEQAAGVAIGDKNRLRRVLFHLVDNAVKFTEAGGITVRARVTTDPASLTFEVEDTGIGIPDDRHLAIFERFVQVDSGTTRRFNGSGLGLALSRELILAMGGQISVASAPGAGSLFRADLPIAVQSLPGRLDPVPARRLAAQGRPAHDPRDRAR